MMGLMLSWNMLFSRNLKDRLNLGLICLLLLYLGLSYYPNLDVWEALCI